MSDSVDLYNRLSFFINCPTEVAGITDLLKGLKANPLISSSIYFKAFSDSRGDIVEKLKDLRFYVVNLCPGNKIEEILSRTLFCSENENPKIEQCLQSFSNSTGQNEWLAGFESLTADEIFTLVKIARNRNVPELERYCYQCLLCNPVQLSTIQRAYDEELPYEILYQSFNDSTANFEEIREDFFIVYLTRLSPFEQIKASLSWLKDHPYEDARSLKSHLRNLDLGTDLSVIDLKVGETYVMRFNDTTSELFKQLRVAYLLQHKGYKEAHKLLLEMNAQLAFTKFYEPCCAGLMFLFEKNSLKGSQSLKLLNFDALFFIVKFMKEHHFPQAERYVLNFIKHRIDENPMKILESAYIQNLHDQELLDLHLKNRKNNHVNIRDVGAKFLRHYIKNFEAMDQWSLVTTWCYSQDKIPSSIKKCLENLEIGTSPIIVSRSSLYYLKNTLKLEDSFFCRQLDVLKHIEEDQIDQAIEILNQLKDSNFKTFYLGLCRHISSMTDFSDWVEKNSTPYTRGILALKRVLAGLSIEVGETPLHYLYKKALALQEASRGHFDTSYRLTTALLKEDVSRDTLLNRNAGMILTHEKKFSEASVHFNNLSHSGELIDQLNIVQSNLNCANPWLDKSSLIAKYRVYKQIEVVRLYLDQRPEDSSLLDDLISAFPDDMNLKREKLRLLISHGFLRKARPLLNDVDFPFESMLYYFQTRDFDKVIALGKTSQADFSTSLQIFKILGDTYFEKHCYEEAVTHYYLFMKKVQHLPLAEQRNLVDAGMLHKASVSSSVLRNVRYMNYWTEKRAALQTIAYPKLQMHGSEVVCKKNPPAPRMKNKLLDVLQQCWVNGVSFPYQCFEGSFLETLIDLQHSKRLELENVDLDTLKALKTYLLKKDFKLSKTEHVDLYLFADKYGIDFLSSKIIHEVSANPSEYFTLKDKLKYTPLYFILRKHVLEMNLMDLDANNLCIYLSELTFDEAFEALRRYYSVDRPHLMEVIKSLLSRSALSTEELNQTHIGHMIKVLLNPANARKILLGRGSIDLNTISIFDIPNVQDYPYLLQLQALQHLRDGDHAATRMILDFCPDLCKSMGDEMMGFSADTSDRALSKE